MAVKESERTSERKEVINHLPFDNSRRKTQDKKLKMFNFFHKAVDEETSNIITIMNLLKTHERTFLVLQIVSSSRNRTKVKNTNKRLALIIRNIYNLIARYTKGVRLPK